MPRRSEFATAPRLGDHRPGHRSKWILPLAVPGSDLPITAIFIPPTFLRRTHETPPLPAHVAADHGRRPGAHGPPHARPVPRVGAGVRPADFPRRLADRVYPALGGQDQRPLGILALDHERRRLEAAQAHRRLVPALVARPHPPDI